MNEWDAPGQVEWFASIRRRWPVAGPTPARVQTQSRRARTRPRSRSTTDNNLQTSKPPSLTFHLRAGQALALALLGDGFQEQGRLVLAAANRRGWERNAPQVPRARALLRRCCMRSPAEPAISRLLRPERPNCNLQSRLETRRRQIQVFPRRSLRLRAMRGTGGYYCTLPPEGR